MICCLNPNCTQPNNPDTADSCQTCGSQLIKELRGRYRPVRLIGRGGFGRTYLAVDSDRLNMGCVIKQFAPQTQGTKSFSKAVQLFEQEALRLNELGEHPQIPSLLAYFEHNHYLYLVQQAIEGRTLYQELQKKGAYSETSMISLLQDILPVLQFIHDHGVIHRDITPTNIIRRKLDNKPVLIDFGVAKQFRETILYEPGTRIGTEGYAPIEQLRSGQAYPSSDLYSLGATCLHLLTGIKPELLYSPLEGRWMWQKSLEQNDRSINPLLGQLLERLVTDMVSERYQSAKAVIVDLRRIESSRGVVPGWIPRNTSTSLFEQLPPDRASGPVQPSPQPQVPPTVPPQISGPRASGPSKSRPSQPPASFPRSGARRSSGIRGKVSGWHCVGELKGHSSWVTTVDFNPRTPTLVSGSLDDTIRVWNLQTGQNMITLDGHSRGVNQVKIGAGGQVLASCGDDDLVKVWNLSDGSLLHTLSGHMRDVTSVAISQDGYLLASGSEDRTIKLWKLDKGTLAKTLTGSAGMIRSVAWAHQSGFLVSGGLDNKVRLWNLESGKMVRALPGHLNSVNEIAMSNEGGWIASASKDRSVRIWDLASGNLLQTLRGHTQEVNTVAITTDSRAVISGGSDGTVRIWNAQSGELLHTLSGHNNAVHSLAVHRNGRLIASASADKLIKLWKWMG